MITTQAIAEKFGVTVGTVHMYLKPSSNVKNQKADAMREYAALNGWYEHMKKCPVCGREFKPGCNKAKYCPECRGRAFKDYQTAYYKKKKESRYWYGGCFHTKAEENNRMIELREQGFSNEEIAKKIGRVRETIRRAIGAQPEEMTKKNHQIGAKIYAQKNAARKQYVIDQSVAEYNKLVEEVRSVEAHLSKIKQDLAAKEQAVQKNARRTVKTPSISFATTEIAG